MSVSVSSTNSFRSIEIFSRKPPEKARKYMELKTICTIGEAVKYIKEQGANISVRELRDIAREKDLPFRRGAGRTLLYRSSELINAFDATFLRPSEILALANARKKKEAAR